MFLLQKNNATVANMFSIVTHHQNLLDKKSLVILLRLSYYFFLFKFIYCYQLNKFNMIYILVAFIQGYAICRPQNKIMRWKAVTAYVYKVRKNQF